MRKKILVLLFLFFAITLSACGKKNETQVNSQAAELKVSDEVIETGRVVDMTSLTGKVIAATPGDVLYVKFVHKDKNKEYSIVNASKAAEALSLKDHKVTKDEKTGEITVEWYFKVEKTGQFDLKFDYGQIGKKPEKTIVYNIFIQ